MSSFMKFVAPMVLFTMSACVYGSDIGGPDANEVGCTKDTDCRGNRICVAMVCTDPVTADASAVADAGGPDGGANDGGLNTSDGGTCAIENHDGYTSFRIGTAYGYSIPANTGLPRFPVGAQAKFVVTGSNNSVGALLHSVDFEVVSGSQRVQVSADCGSVKLKALAPGIVTMVARVATSNGERTAQADVEIVPAEDAGVRLEAFTIQADDPSQSISFRYPSSQPKRNATVPTDLSARVITYISWSGVSTIRGNALLEPEDLTYTKQSGAGSVDSKGVMSASTPGTTEVQVSYAAPQGGVGTLTTTTDAEFIAEAPVTGLLAAAKPDVILGGPPVNEIGRSTLPAGSPTPLKIGNNTATLTLTEGSSAALFIATRHTEGTASYVRWQAPGLWVTRTAGDAAVATVDASGVARWGAPGVQLRTVTLQGFDLPIVFMSKYAPTTTVQLRAVTPALSYSIPVQWEPSVCTPLEFFLKVGSEPERKLSAIETMVLSKYEASQQPGPFVSDLLGGGGQVGAGPEFCNPVVRYVGVGSPQTGSITVSYLSVFRGAVNYVVTF